MKRTQVQLDEATYVLAKRRASAENKPLDAVIGEAVTQYLTSPSGRPAGLEGFTFIGSGRSDPKGPRLLSERHDEALAEDFAE